MTEHPKDYDVILRDHPRQRRVFQRHDGCGGGVVLEKNRFKCLKCKAKTDSLIKKS